MFEDSDFPRSRASDDESRAYAGAATLVLAAYLLGFLSCLVLVWTMG